MSQAYDVCLGLTVIADSIQDAVQRASNEALTDPNLTVLVGVHEPGKEWGQSVTHVVRVRDLQMTEIPGKRIPREDFT